MSECQKTELQIVKNTYFQLTHYVGLIFTRHQTEEKAKSPKNFHRVKCCDIHMRWRNVGIRTSQEQTR